MIDTLEPVVDDLRVVNSKLLLLVSSSALEKSDLLRQLAGRRNLKILNIGAELGRALLAIPTPRRHLHAADLLKCLADEFSRDGLLLMDNLELLFDRELKLNPLDLLRRQSQARRVVAVWPGTHTDNRLSYANSGHPEYRDYSCDGVVLFEVN